jgi:hypothetical protein
VDLIEGKKTRDEKEREREREKEIFHCAYTGLKFSQN